MRLPVDTIYDVAPAGDDERILLLMLPGAKNTPQQLADYGFIRAVRERCLPIDVLALDAHVDLYLERSYIERLLHEVLASLQAKGYRRIWLFGISLGGLGSMLCATQRAAEIEGVLLLAPFLGTRGIIAEVAAAGGLRNWRMAEHEGGDHERAFLAQLQACPFHAAHFPRIYLGYGQQDRYSAASELLAECLPPQRVLTTAGGHDWKTWRGLWGGLLDKSPFTLP